MLKLVDYKGTIGIANDFSPDYNKPVDGRTIFLTAVKAANIPMEWLGYSVRHMGQSQYEFFANGQWKHIFALPEGEQIYDTRPIKKPRLTKWMKETGHEWVWNAGNWSKRMMSNNLDITPTVEISKLHHITFQPADAGMHYEPWVALHTDPEMCTPDHINELWNAWKEGKTMDDIVECEMEDFSEHLTSLGYIITTSGGSMARLETIGDGD